MAQHRRTVTEHWVPYSVERKCADPIKKWLSFQASVSSSAKWDRCLRGILGGFKEVLLVKTPAQTRLAAACILSVGVIANEGNNVHLGAKVRPG